MLLKEALELLHAGESMVRESWDLSDGYLQLMKGMSHVWKIVLHPNPNAGNYIFSFEDLEASDWKKFELLEEAKAVVASQEEIIDL